MKLKFKAVVGAVMAIGSASSFAAAAPALVCPTTVTTQAQALEFAQKCAPEQTLFIGGASTLKDVVATILKADIFDTNAMTPIVVNDKGSVSGLNGNVKALYGISKTNKRVLAIYNYNNGSAAGVSQLLGKPTLPSVAVSAKGIPESDVVFVGPMKTATTVGTLANTFCVSASAGTNAAPAVDCTSHRPQQADMALTDVAPKELYKLYPGATAKLSTLKADPLFLQSFGVVVSPALYTALQTQQGLTSADQPSIRRADYASLVTKAGSVKSLAALTGNSALTDKLTLARRDDLSGTQASSNIFFANGQCGTSGSTATDAKIAAAGGLLGGLSIISTTDTTYTDLNILSAVVSQDVKNAVANTGYAIGVLNVGSGSDIANGDTTITAKGKFVKIDGISPNYTKAGVKDPYAQIANGDYPFVMTTYAAYVPAVLAKDTAKKALVDAMVTGFSDSSLHQIAGLAYLDKSTSTLGATVQSKVLRTNGNNCSPLIKG